MGYVLAMCDPQLPVSITTLHPPGTRPVLRRARRTSVPCSLALALLGALLVASCGDTQSRLASNEQARVRTPPASGSYRVVTQSMEPTLPLGTTVTFAEGAPTVGAIVVFHPSEGWLWKKCGSKGQFVRAGGRACDAPGASEARIKLVKRLVGAPGDEIYIREGHVYRKLGRSHAFVREPDSYTRACGVSPSCNFPVPIKIKGGYWFLMGDNRGASDDSRFSGPVPTAWIIGVVTHYQLPRF